MTSLTYFTVSGDYRNVSDPVVSGSTNAPHIEIISGLATFTPRLPVGFTAFVDNYDVIAPINEVQRVSVGAEGGTFTLTYNGQTTSGIAYNAAATAVASALIALSNIGSSDVAVVGNAGGPWDVTFQGTLASTDVSVMTIDGSSLDGPTPAVTITTTRGGVAAVNEVQVITLSSVTGGVFSVTYAGQTTGDIAYNAAASVVQSALQALSGIGAGNVSVGGSAGGPYTVTFVGALGGRNIWQMTASNAGLSGSGANVVVSTSVSGVAAVNEVQTLQVVNSVDGSFTLTFNGQTTVATAFNASVNTVRTNLEALSNINVGDVVVTGIAGTYTVAFQGTLAGTNVTAITANSASLVGADATAAVFTTTTGQASSSRPTAIAIPPRNARIWEGKLSTINVTDTSDIELVSNIPELGLEERGFDELIYDIEFSQVVYAEGSQTIQNFGFVAPTDGTPVNITDPMLDRLPYLGQTQLANINEVRILHLLLRVDVTTSRTLDHLEQQQYLYLLRSGANPTMPDAVSNTSYYTIKNISGGNVTLHTTSGQTIEGSTTYILADRESLTLISDNANWGII